MKAGIGQKSFRIQPIASGLFVACGYSHVIGPGVAEREGSTESLVILRRARSWLDRSLSVLPLFLFFILVHVVLMLYVKHLTECNEVKPPHLNVPGVFSLLNYISRFSLTVT